MTTFAEARRAIAIKNHSNLCVGLDPDPARFPGPWQGDPRYILDFCAAIVGATRDLVLAFKPQFAYFARHRAENQLESLIAYIHNEWPGIPVILDAKRGDIGSTAEQYACEAFERYRADAVTLSPFMGPDTIEPFLHYDGKGLVLLTWTSNPGSAALQARETVLSVDEMKAIEQQLGEELTGQRLPIHDWLAFDISHNWGIPPERLSLVVGATNPGGAKRIRQLVGPDVSLLIPGIGAQGGSEADAMAAWTSPGSVMVSASRSTTYPKLNPGEKYFDGVRRVAMSTRDKLNHYCNV